MRKLILSSTLVLVAGLGCNLEDANDEELAAASEESGSDASDDVSLRSVTVHDYPYLTYGPTSCGQCNELLACPEGGSIPGDCTCMRELRCDPDV